MTLESFSQGLYEFHDDLGPTATEARSNYVAISAARPKVQYFDVIFPKLVNAWQAETLFMSSPEDMKGVATFKDIVKFGYMALPYIIDEIARNPSWLFMAASEITKHDATSDSERGNVKLMSGAWVAWYRKSRREYF